MASGLVPKTTTIRCLSWRCKGDFLFVAIGDSSLGEVIRRHLQSDAIACQHANSIASEFSRQMRENRPILIQLNAEQSAWKLFHYCPGHFNTVFFTHPPPEMDMRICQSPKGRNSLSESIPRSWYRTVEKLLRLFYS